MRKIENLVFLKQNILIRHDMKNPFKKLIKNVIRKKNKRKVSRLKLVGSKRQEKKLIDVELLGKLKDAGYKGHMSAENVESQIEQVRVIKTERKRRERKKALEVKPIIQQEIKQNMAPMPMLMEPPKTVEPERLIIPVKSIKQIEDRHENDRQLDQKEDRSFDDTGKSENSSNSVSGIGILFSEPKKINLNKKKILDEESKGS